ncbi:MAG TPA: CBS domain-containing protein [Calidithermus sp.]|nr:CBS domain-containing protein [Calidithermus sp.]
MFRRVLVAYDGSDSAQAALQVGIALATALGSHLASVSVEEHLPRYAATLGEVEAARERIEAHFRALTKQARDTAAVEGVDLDAQVRRGHEVAEILAAAREGRFDLLIVGAHGHSRIFERVIGSTALSVARLAPCSTWIARSGAAAMSARPVVNRLLVGLDGSPLGRLAFRTALDLAAVWDAAVVGLTVREDSPLGRTDDAPLDALRVAAEEHARAAGVAFTHVARRGHAAQWLREEARTVGADLIVLGATGLEHPWSSSLGGTASSVAAEAPCSVLLVRPPQAALQVAEVMTRAVSTVRPETPLAEVVDRLLRRDVKAVPVVDERRHVVGIITGGDLLRRAHLRLRLGFKPDLETDALRQHLQAVAHSRMTARDVMTRHVRTVSPETDLATVIDLMVRHRVKRLPVVDNRKELVGIVSRADVLRAIAAAPETEPAVAPTVPAAARTVGEAATRQVPVLLPTAGADEVLQAVLATPLRRVVVTDHDGRVLGLIGDRDLLVRAGRDSRPWLLRVFGGDPHGAARSAAPGSGLTAADLMAPRLITVRPGDSLARAIQLMMQHGVKRLIVVDDDGRFRGLVDRREILRVLAGEPGSEGRPA